MGRVRTKLVKKASRVIIEKYYGKSVARINSTATLVNDTINTTDWSQQATATEQQSNSINSLVEFCPTNTNCDSNITSRLESAQRQHQRRDQLKLLQHRHVADQEARDGAEM